MQEELTPKERAVLEDRADSAAIINMVWKYEAYKFEEKDGFITSIDGHAQDEAKGLYWMFKVNGEMAPKAANQITVKDGDKLEFYQEVYQQ